MMEVYGMVNASARPPAGVGCTCSWCACCAWCGGVPPAAAVSGVVRVRPVPGVPGRRGGAGRIRLIFGVLHTPTPAAQLRRGARTRPVKFHWGARGGHKPMSVGGACGAAFSFACFRFASQQPFRPFALAPFRRFRRFSSLRFSYAGASRGRRAFRSRPFRMECAAPVRSVCNVRRAGRPWQRAPA